MTDREQQLESLLSEIYGASLELFVVVPPSRMTDELRTYLLTVGEKCKKLDVSPWKVKFTEPA